MEKFIKQELARMQEALQEASLQGEDALQRAERSVHIVHSSLGTVKEYIANYNFKDQTEEILFFKELKPQFLGELIFYEEVFYFEAGKPVGDRDKQLSYVRQAMEQIQAFFERHQSFYLYYRTGKVDHDHLLFVRGTEDGLLLPGNVPDLDTEFSTIGSQKLSQFQGYTLFKDYLDTYLHQLHGPAPLSGGVSPSGHQWTDSKAALIELAYALHSRGSVDHGKIDVKQIIADLETAFNVQVGNFYRAFQSMRIRKKNRTSYLDGLKESLEKRMDETDLQF